MQHTLKYRLKKRNQFERNTLEFFLSFVLPELRSGIIEVLLVAEWEVFLLLKISAKEEDGKTEKYRGTIHIGEQLPSGTEIVREENIIEDSSRSC